MERLLLQELRAAVGGSPGKRPRTCREAPLSPLMSSWGKSQIRATNKPLPRSRRSCATSLKLFVCFSLGLDHACPVLSPAGPAGNTEEAPAARAHGRASTAANMLVCGVRSASTAGLPCRGFLTPSSMQPARGCWQGTGLADQAVSSNVLPHFTPSPAREAGVIPVYRPSSGSLCAFPKGETQHKALLRL